MAKFLFKQCIRCSGDLVYESDCWGSRYTCLQCGWDVDAALIQSEGPVLGWLTSRLSASDGMKEAAKSLRP